MSVDTVNYALTRVRLRIAQDQSNSFSAEGKLKLLMMCAVLRDDLLQENILWFDQHVNDYLAREPDATSYLLDELFAELGFPEGIREQLTAELLAA